MSEQLKNGALYIRVSTDKQEELSPDAQKRLLLEYAKKNGIIINDEFVFIENGISGKKAEKRPEFMKMIALAKSKNHPLDVILVWKFSRFARNQEESIVYKSLLKKNNVDVVSVSEPLIDGPFGSLIERIIEWMDEYYSIRLSGEVYRGMTENALRGRYQCSAPLGYKMENGIPVIVYEEAEIVRKIFNMYVEENLGMFTIAKKLNEYGCHTKSGGNFERRAIEYILKNPVYCGMIRWNYSEGSNRRLKDKSEWIIREGNHEPIISKDLFNAAASRYENEYHSQKKKPSGTYKHWLSGLVKCSVCGRSLSSSTSKNRYGKGYIYFQCYGYRKGLCNITHQISAAKLEKAVLDSLKSILSGSSSISYEKVKIKKPAGDSEISIIKSQLERIDIKEKRLTAAYLDGIDTIDEYRANKEKLSEERSELQMQLDKVISINSGTEKSDAEMLKDISNIYDIITSDNATIEYKSEVINRIVSSIIFDKPNDTLKINLYKSV